MVLIAGCISKPAKKAVAETSYKDSLQTNNKDSLYGTWVVKEFKFGNSVSAFGKEEAAKYIGKQIILNADKVNIFGDECSQPSFDITKNNSKDFFYNDYNESDSSVIPSQDSVTVDELSCSSTPVFTNSDSLNFNYSLIFLNRNEMITAVNGAYLFLSKE